MTSTAQRARRILSRLLIRIGRYPYVVLPMCMIGLAAGATIWYLATPTFVASTLLVQSQGTSSIEPADGSSHGPLDDSLKIVVARDILRSIDLVDDRYHSIYSEDPFSLSAIEKEGRLVQAMDFQTAGDSIHVTFRSKSEFEAVTLSAHAAKFLIDSARMNRQREKGGFEAALVRLIDDRRRILAEQEDDENASGAATSSATRSELETLTDLLSRFDQESKVDSPLRTVGKTTVAGQKNDGLFLALTFFLMALGGFLGVIGVSAANKGRRFVASSYDVYSSAVAWIGELRTFRTPKLKSGDQDDRVSPVFLKPGRYSEQHPMVPLFSQMASMTEFPCCVHVHSSERKVGKTIVSLNLAFLAAKVGLSVLLIDSDHRSRKLTRELSATDTPGFLDLLWGRASMNDVIRTSTVRTLDFLPIGTEKYGAQPLQREIVAVMELLRRKYDLIVIDGGVDRISTVELQVQADAVVAVARCGYSDKGRFNRMLRSAASSLKQFVIVTDTNVGAADESSENWRLTKMAFELIDSRRVDEVVERRSTHLVKAELEDVLAPYRADQRLRVVEAPVSI